MAGKGGSKKRLSDIQLHELGLFLRFQVRIGKPLEPLEVKKHIKRKYKVNYISIVSIRTLMTRLIDEKEPQYALNQRMRSVAAVMSRREAKAIENQFIGSIHVTHVTTTDQTDEKEA